MRRNCATSRYGNTKYVLTSEIDTNTRTHTPHLFKTQVHKQASESFGKYNIYSKGTGSIYISNKIGETAQENLVDWSIRNISSCKRLVFVFLDTISQHTADSSFFDKADH